MPKFLKACNNRHFHEKWSKSEDSMQVINLRKNYGLSELANIFQTFLKEEVGLKAPVVTNVCIDCLEQCLQRRVFTKYLSASNNKAIEHKVRDFETNRIYAKIPRYIYNYNDNCSIGFT